MMCIFSIFLNQRPDKIMIHCETCDFKGYYWKRVMSKRSLRRIIQINKIPMKRRIFNRLTGYIHHRWLFVLEYIHRLSRQLASHRLNRFDLLYAWRADVWRLLILMQYGGIYVDNDIFVVNSLDKFRRYEMTVGFENMTEHVMGNQVLIAHRNARFLRICYDTYRTSYNRHKWYYNAGMLPYFPTFRPFWQNLCCNFLDFLKENYLAKFLRITHIWPILCQRNSVSSILSA